MSYTQLRTVFNYDDNNWAYNEKGESLFTRFQQVQGYQNVALLCKNVKLAYMNYLSNSWKPNACKGTEVACKFRKTRILLETGTVQ